MLTTRLLSRTIALAMTASVTLLAGCPTANVVTPTSSPSPTDSVAPTAMPTATATVAPTTMPTAMPTSTTPTSSGVGATPTASTNPSATISTNPSSIVGGSSQNDISALATFNGKVYDPSSVPVENATVNARSIDAGVNWTGEAQLTTGGAFVFRNAPVGTRLAVTVTKDGWTTRTRSEVLKSNLQGDPSANVFNFGGPGTGDFVYAIQDEPEITLLKINGREVTSAASSDGLQINGTPSKPTKPTSNQLSEETNGAGIATTIGYLPNLTGVNNDALDVEMTFSEPVRRDDVENNFRVTSQSVFSSTPDQRRPFLNAAINTSFPSGESFTVDQTFPSISFVWSADDKMVTFKTNRAILANRDGREARYMVDYAQGGFRDRTDKRAREMKQFRFSPSQVNDYAIYSVKNDEIAPTLLSVAAREGGSSNDVLELKFSESLDVINKSSYAGILSDPVLPSDSSRQLVSRDANTNGVNTISNNASLFGFFSPVLNAGITSNKFFASYMVAKVTSGNLTNATFRLSALGDVNKAFSINASRSNLASNGANTTNDTLLRSARVSGSTIFLELSPNAFQKDDRIVVSAGNRINGQYNDTTRGITNKSLDVSTDTSSNNSFDFATFVDPSGRSIDTGNETTSANFSVGNKQRVTTAQ